MKQHILLGLNAELSPTTQHVLHTVSELFVQRSSEIYLLLMNVVPFPPAVTTHPGLYTSQIMSSSNSSWEQQQAEEFLHKVRLMLHQDGFAQEHMEEIVRIGAPAEEIVRVAAEFNVSMIVIGNRYDSFWQKLRRFLLGSTTRRILQLAPCPVMIIVPPRLRHPGDLVQWYENALRLYLRENPHTLLVLTPQQTASRFIPPTRQTSGRKEIAAATLALEQLVNKGVLCRHYINNEVRYVND